MFICCAFNTAVPIMRPISSPIAIALPYERRDRLRRGAGAQLADDRRARFRLLIARGSSPVEHRRLSTRYEPRVGCCGRRRLLNLRKQAASTGLVPVLRARRRPPARYPPAPPPHKYSRCLGIRDSSPRPRPSRRSPDAHAESRRAGRGRTAEHGVVVESRQLTCVSNAITGEALPAVGLDFPARDVGGIDGAVADEDVPIRADADVAGVGGGRRGFGGVCRLRGRRGSSSSPRAPRAPHSALPTSRSLSRSPSRSAGETPFAASL